MTNPTITYDHGYMFDCNTTTGWSEYGALGGNGTFSSVADDIFILENTGGAVDYAVVNDDDIDKNAASYPYITFRYKTESGTSVKAQIIAEYDDATEKTILAETASTLWTTDTVSLDNSPNSNTLDHIRLYANDALGEVYYDYALVHGGTFTFPHVGPGGIQCHFPLKIAQIPIPSRQGDILQNLGMAAPEIVIRGNVLQGETWDSASNPPFEYFFRSLFKDPWNLLTFDMNGKTLRFKVMFKDFVPNIDVGDSTMNLTYELHFLVYSRSNFDYYLWGEWEWLGYEP